MYSSKLTLDATAPVSEPVILPYTVTGADYNVPSPPDGRLVYTAFISSNSTAALRVGPESFNAAAYSDY